MALIDHVRPGDLMGIYFVFDKGPGDEASRFIETEDENGKSISVGEWVARPDGLVALKVRGLTPEKAESPSKDWRTPEARSFVNAVHKMYPISEVVIGDVSVSLGKVDVTTTIASRKRVPLPVREAITRAAYELLPSMSEINIIYDVRSTP